MQNIPRGALMRILFCLQILCIAFFSFEHPGSVVHTLVHASGESTWFILAAMCFIAVAGLVDTVVNDLLPERYTFNQGLQVRHTLFMLLAIGYALIMHAAVQAEIYSAIPYFVTNIAFIIICAFGDVQRRYKPPEFHQRKTDKKTNEGSLHA
jgi:hypothetical protein